MSHVIPRLIQGGITVTLALFMLVALPLRAAPQIVTVDSVGDVGRYSSLKLTANGRPVVAYSDLTNGALKLATCTANCTTASPTWQIVTVDSGGSLSGVGPGLSLALDANDRPLISYFDINNFDLKFATCTANCATASPTWQIVTVESVGNVGYFLSLKLNAAGQPVIGYSDATNFQLKLATCTANCASASPIWQIVVVDSSSGGGQYISLAFNPSGQPVLAYRDTVNDNIKVATCTANCATAGPTWQVVTVSDTASGDNTSLAFSPGGQPVFSFRNTNSDTLRFASCTANCATSSPTWQVVTIESGTYMALDTSVAFTSGGQPVIGYSHLINRLYKLATCTANCTTANSTWRIVTVDNVAAPSFFFRFGVSLAVNANGQPVMSYYDYRNSHLKLATLDAEFTVTASPNPATGGGLLTCAPTSGGTQAATATVTAGTTASCVATPDAGYTTQSISGCSGTATGVGVNNFTTGVATASCTVTATFAPTTVGSCGSANGVATVNAPTANLCASGTASAVTAAASNFNWTCNGSVVTITSEDANCSAPRQFTITPSPSAGGNLSCTPGTINPGATSSCTAVPLSGYTTQSISGCGGIATGVGVNSYTTGTVTANCTVTATFAPTTVGACGSANGVASLFAPTTNLCSTGTASGVSTTASSFNWTCNGSVAAITTDDANCSAPRQFTITASPGAGGNLTCMPNPVNSGATSTCTATPLSGYTTQGISGCGGTATGVGANSFATGAITSPCTVAATFAPTTVGACGSANGVASLVAPAANLCSAGTASAVSTAAGSFNWTCNGSVAAISTEDASCSSTRQFTITASAVGVGGNGGSLSCASSTVNAGGSVTCTAIPARGYFTVGISGCGGTTSGPWVNSYITGAVSSDCTVTATFAASPPEVIPTLNQWVVLLLALLVFSAAAWTRVRAVVTR